MKKTIVTTECITPTEIDYFFDGKYVGTKKDSIGFYGNSTGIFLQAESTCPLTEYADENGLELVDKNGNAIPGWE